MQDQTTRGIGVAASTDRPTQPVDHNVWVQRGRSPVRVFLLTIGGIVLAEVVAMLVVYQVRGWPYTAQVILDAAIMVVIIYPLLYYQTFKPLLFQLKNREMSDKITRTRLRILQFSAGHALDELLQYTVDEFETLTGSVIGFFHFVESDEKTLWLQAWSSNTVKNMCRAEGKGSHYNLDLAGVWVDCARQRRPVIHNDYASLPTRKGLPEGHAPITRVLTVPIIRFDRLVAILGVGNKADLYTDHDVELISTLADFAWDVIENKRAEEALVKSEEKFRTLVDWTIDWEKWVDPTGKIIYISPSCERISGYTPQEFMNNPQLLVDIVHPEDRQLYMEHQENVHDATSGPISMDYRIIARDGTEHWIEHHCRPLLGRDGSFLGRRVSSRDITERKRTLEEIKAHNQREAMLSRSLQTIQTDIARDLHDTLGQNISFLRMNLEQLADGERNQQKPPAWQIENMSRAANESYDLIRDMLAMLQLGNSTEPLILFKRYAAKLEERSKIKVEFQNHGTAHELTTNQVRQLFYIYREALNNIEKYANPTKVSTRFTWGENELGFEVSDNGRGFDPKAINSDGHYGLKFMRERAEVLRGRFAVKSAPNEGTRIIINLPYDESLILHTN